MRARQEEAALICCSLSRVGPAWRSIHAEVSAPPVLVPQQLRPRHNQDDGVLLFAPAHLALRPLRGLILKQHGQRLRQEEALPHRRGRGNGQRKGLLWLLLMMLSPSSLSSSSSPLQSTVCHKIMEAVLHQSSGTAEKQIISLSQDSFYRELRGEEMDQARRGQFNFDHPGEEIRNRQLDRLHMQPVVPSYSSRGRMENPG